MPYSCRENDVLGDPHSSINTSARAINSQPLYKVFSIEQTWLHRIGKRIPERLGKGALLKQVVNGFRSTITYRTTSVEMNASCYKNRPYRNTGMVALPQETLDFREGFYFPHPTTTKRIIPQITYNRASYFISTFFNQRHHLRMKTKIFGPLC